MHDLLRKNLREYSESDEYRNNMERPEHMRIMAGTMRAWFEENTEIVYAWSATNPYGTPDPTVEFASTVRFSPWDLSSPMSLPGLATRIAAAVSAGIVTHPPGFLLPPGSFLIRPLTLPRHAVAEECLMKCIVEPVCDWITTLVNPSPLSGSHGAFIGAASGMSISLKPDTAGA